MTLIRLVERDELPPDVRAVLDEGAQAYGKVLHTWRAVAHNPAAFKAYLPYLRAVFGPSSLSQRIKDLTAVRVCLLNHCRYSLSHRVASARAQGIADDDLIALADLEANRGGFASRELAALDLADEMTVRVSEVSYRDDRQAVSAELLGRLKQQFSDTEISELALSISLWNALTRYHRVMDFDLDMDPPPPELDARL